MDREIDIVLLTVDGSAPGYAELHEAHGMPFRPCHVRSLGELRYALRSIDTNASWVRRLFLVVQSQAHVPPWLDRDAVQVVCHDEFMPAEILPVFNQFPIQRWLAEIPNLGPRFVLWHDDYFAAKILTPEFFFPSDTEERVFRDSPVPHFLTRLLPDDVYVRFAVNTARLLRPRNVVDRLLGAYLHPHVPLAVRTREWRQMMGRFETAPIFHATTRRKVEATSEDPSGVLLDMLYANVVDSARRSTVQRAFACLTTQTLRVFATLMNRAFQTRLPMLHGKYGIRNDPYATRTAMRRLERDRPTIFCINDDAYDRYDDHGTIYHDGLAVNPRSLRAFEVTMQKLFPAPSRYERAHREAASRP